LPRGTRAADEVVKEIEAAGGQGRAQQMNIGDHGSVEAAVWRGRFTGGALDAVSTPREPSIRSPSAS
jgi:hypothetical protein